MKKRALRKDFYMEIRKSLNRFLSIFLIVAMGVAFYSGIQSSAPDMQASGDAYFDRQKLMDLRVISTLGLTEEDLQALEGLESIKAAEGAYMTDVLYGEGAGSKVLHMESITEQFQELQVEEGRLPETAGECFLDATVAANYEIQVGDTLTIREDGEEEDWILKQSSFTVVGIGASPAYISFDKGNTTLGSGEVAGFCYILPEEFDMDVYPQIFLEVEGAQECSAFTDDYKEVVENARAEVEEIADARCEARYSDIKSEADEKIADARKELEDGKQEAEEKLAEAQADIEEGESKLADGKTQLEQGKQDLADAKKKVEDGRAELTEKEQELADAKIQLADGRKELADAKESLAASESEFQEQKASSEEQISQGETALADAQKQYEDGLSQYEAGASQLNQAYEDLETKESALSQAAEASEEGKAAYEAAKPELEAARAELDAQKAVLEETKKQLDAAKEEIDTQNASLVSARQQLSDAEAQIEEARAAIAANEEELNNAEAEIEDGERKIEEGWTEIEDGEAEIAKAEADIAEAEQTIAENEQKLEDGKKDYAEAEKEVNDTIADGEEKIAEAEQELADLDYPEWTVYDRDDLTDYTGYGENADRMRSIGRVFPVLFFLVAALISLTTMTRMVEEERTQIGTLKALGYGKAAIAGKYICYALLATVGGSVLGVLVGEKILPYIIINAYGIMYQHMDVIVLDYQMDHALTASLVALFCTMAGTISACYRELASTPAVLMRPPAPKEGKRVFLERVPFIWKRLNFTWKSTVRNLFRYKKRFFMTIFGIGGCMALLLVGFGLRDSIMDVAVIQYQELQLYQGMVILDEDASMEERKQLEASIEENPDVTGHINVYMKKMTMEGKGGSNDVYLMVPETLEGFEDFVHTRDRITGQIYTLSDNGVILAEKTAKLLGVKVGDVITMKKSESEVGEAKVEAICENYMLHYCYMSPKLYQEIFGEEMEYNNVLFSTDGQTETDVELIGQEILQEKAALSISYTGSIKERLDDMLGSLDIVIIVLIVSAGMLAFVVLYNLNNINVNERKRELATLKVLGFFDGEVSAYVYRENILLTLVGAALGVVLGIILHQYIIVTVEIEQYMFGRKIEFFSFVISILLTCAFSAIVNVVMHFKLKKIDMVESLKSVE